ncbi:hypothetical protein LG296_08315 [Ureibacillus chungkukjangi]|uniref:tetratricopeptide repeat protein n=1 Tax=Ureibacillus chungkukjangi TaxID=1202712 RepID=UPI00384AC2D9
MNFVDFKKSISRINEIIYFDREHFLREKTYNSSKLKQYIQSAEGLLKSTNILEGKYFIMGTLGNFYRVLGETQKAINILERCLMIASTELNFKREIVCKIRLGEALKYNNNHLKALEVFDGALELSLAHDSLHLDYVLQHKGKCLLELNKVIEAEKCFKVALKLREYKSNEELIKSTQLALDFIKNLKEN